MYQLTPQEEAFYKQMWSQLDPNGNGYAEGKDTVQFFKKSRLPVQQLKAVWVTAVRNEEGKLFYHEFTTAMRLIAYCQNGFEMSDALLNETRPVPLPVMDGFPVQAQQQAPIQQQLPQQQFYQTQPVQSQVQISLQQFVEPKNSPYDLPPDLYAKYETCFRQQDKGNQGYIPSDPAKAFFQKSGLPLPTLMNLWELVDDGRKGYLSKNEFIVAVHLIALCRKDISLPQFLPDSLIQIMKRDVQDQVRPTSQTIQPTLSNQLPPQRVASQNELQGLNQAVNTLQNRVQNQSQQIQLANNLDAQKQIIEDKKKDIDFLNQTIQKLQSFYTYLKTEQDELAAQLASLNGQCAQKQQQMSALQDCIQNQLQTNQALQKQIMESKTQGTENQPPQTAFQTIHLDDDYDYSGYRAKKEKIGSGGNQNNEILPWH